MDREDIEFTGELGTTLRGWFYPAQNAAGPAPVIVMAHGISGVKEMGLGEYAEVFAAGGLNVVVYDHQNFGASDGTPRQELDPVLQYRDYKNAISYAVTRPDVDPDRVGIWGSSFSGGHVLTVAANDRRVKAVVSQVPFVSGPLSLARTVRPDFAAPLREQLQADRSHRFAGGEPTVIPVVSDNPFGEAVMPMAEANAYYTANASPEPSWRNELTVRSIELIGEYDPSSHISRVSPTPLLMIVARYDVTAPAELAFAAYEQAREPKQILVTDGGHFSVYDGPRFEQCSTAARDHFRIHLGIG